MLVWVETDWVYLRHQYGKSGFRGRLIDDLLEGEGGRVLRSIQVQILTFYPAIQIEKYVVKYSRDKNYVHLK